MGVSTLRGTRVVCSWHWTVRGESGEVVLRDLA